MLFTHTTFIGIDPTAEGSPFGYVALSSELDLLALGEGEMDEVMAFVGGQESAFVAVNAPRRPNQGLMADEAVRVKLNPRPRPGRWTGYRLAEYLLGQRNIRITRTPANEENCRGWVRTGFAIFKRLESLGYGTFPAGEEQKQSLEVYPHACYCAWLERTPFPKHTLEGRLQRQLALYDQGLNVPDPMLIFEEITRHRLMQGILPLDDIYSPAELDALAAAYTAWLTATRPAEVSLVGDAGEGQIVVPAAELKAGY